MPQEINESLIYLNWDGSIWRIVNELAQCWKLYISYDEMSISVLFKFPSDLIQAADKLVTLLTRKPTIVKQ